jgi:hypothetical protein
MKTLLVLISALTFGCARLHAWPAVVFNPTNGVIMLPTNFVAANLSSVPVTNNFSGTATNLAGNALVQVTNISLTLAQGVAATNQPTTSTFCGIVTNLASVPFVVTAVAVTNSTTNFLTVSGPFSGAGNFYASGGLFYGTNGYNFYYSGGIWTIYSSSGYANRFDTNPIGYYNDLGFGAATVAQGTGTFSWTVTTNVVTVKADTSFHCNLTTYTNGIVATNIFQ